MASRGLLPFAGNFDRRIAAPMDDMRVATKADLILPATWTAGDGVVYTWKGMVAVVYNDPTPENNGSYLLLADDYTVQASWKKDGGTVDLNTIDTQLNTSTEPETATDTTVLYVIGKAKITALKLYNYISEKLSTVFLKVSEYTGTGTKSVNRAVSSQYAGQANADILGRTIHETYALKDSGITPPVNETVDLNNDTPTYTVTDATAPLLSVTNAADTGGEVIFPTNLTADKSISIQIFRNDTVINGVTYSDGDTVFASFEYDTTSWYITDTEIPEVPDYSDMTVDAMIDNPSITPKPGYIRITGHVWIIGTKVFIRTTDTPTPIGIYHCVGAGAGYSNLVLIAAGTALHTVRVKGGDVWYSQYDGANAGTLIFLKAGEYTDNFINVPDGMVTVNLKKSQILGLSNATGAALTNANTITFTLPTPVAGAFNQSVVYFEVGATLPTIIQPANTLIFGTLILNSNTKYKLQYDQIRMSATTWQRTLNFSKV